MIIECENFFDEFVCRYDTSLDKVSLKIKHSRCVEKICKILARSLSLTDNQIELAQVIGLCHDLGRFYQIEKYDTFNDSQSIDHADASNKVLFDDECIWKFLPPKCYKYVDIIRCAIYNHNKLAVEPGLDGEKKLFCNIIRDADKIDIYRVMATEPFNEVYSTQYENNFVISDSIKELFYTKSVINSDLRKSLCDDFVCKLAFVFDFNYKKSKSLLNEYGYLHPFVYNFIKNSNLKDEKIIAEIKNMHRFVCYYLNS